MQLVFASLNSLFLAEISDLFSKTTADIAIHEGDVALLIDSKQTAFVSPANSLGFMDGGIDKVYSQIMWPPRDNKAGVEQRVKRSIKQVACLDFIDRAFLPIGSAIIVPADVTKSQWLISAPTMLLPQPVANTRNAYWATLAALRCAENFNRAGLERTGKQLIKRIVLTSACCGYGAMSETESARQIYQAWCDFVAEKHVFEKSYSADLYFDNPCMADQPDLYENADFKRACVNIS